MSADARLLEAETVLSATKWCATRPMDEGHLIYNAHTDELHVLTPFAHYLYELCDGTRSVHEIAGFFAPSVARDGIVDLLGSLVARGLLEIDG